MLALKRQRSDSVVPVIAAKRICIIKHCNNVTIHVYMLPLQVTRFHTMHNTRTRKLSVQFESCNCTCWSREFFPGLQLQTNFLGAVSVCSIPRGSSFSSVEELLSEEEQLARNVVQTILARVSPERSMLSFSLVRLSHLQSITSNLHLDLYSYIFYLIELATSSEFV